MPDVQVDQLEGLATNALLNAGLAHEDAAIIVSHLLDAELSGNPTHGFYRLPGVISWAKTEVARGKLSIHRTTENTTILDCGNMHGLLAAQKAVDVAIEMLSQTKVAIIGVRNYKGTTGSIGAYAQQLTKHGAIAIVMCNSEYAVAPTGGKQAILGTNPIAIGIPSTEKAIVVDFATAAWSYGALALAARQGRTVPDGLVLDRDGFPSNDPADADSGVQLPMAGHKGYGLGLAIELLAGPFVGAKAGRNAVPGSDGLVIMALSASLFVSEKQFLTDVSKLIAEIRQSPLAPGSESIRIPGERTDANREAAQSRGSVHVSQETWNELSQHSTN